MRLIHVESFTLKEFFGKNIPPYAILSHRWEKEEVCYQDFLQVEKREHMTGFKKSEVACEQAFKDGYEYLWMDTCCIDKTCSAELSEAVSRLQGLMARIVTDVEVDQFNVRMVRKSTAVLRIPLRRAQGKD